MRRHLWQLRTQKLQWQQRPLLLGILNVTPDSFSDGGRYLDAEAALDRALEMEAEGADVIDIGGESSRPGAELVSAEVELSRVVPVIERLQGRLRIPISIDTWKARVAEAALQAGAEIVNDISAGQWDAQLWPVVTAHRAGYVLMHAPGATATARHDASTVSQADPVSEVLDFLKKYLARAEENGMALTSIVCDPGFGFAKTVGFNLALLQNISSFQILNQPVLVGLSRKSFIKTVGGADHLEVSTLVAQIWATAQGAAIWRVHDVASAAQAARLVGKIQGDGEVI